MEYSHEPVMLAQCLEALRIRADGVYADGTAGLGGHSEAIARRLTSGRLIALDRDGEALSLCGKRLAGLPVTLVKSDFRRLDAVLDDLGVDRIDGVLLDLGVSSLQLDKPERGFSYRFDAPLDMRMDECGALTAARLVNEWPADELIRILYAYGEERYAPAIVRAIVRNRPIDSTGELARVVAAAMPAVSRREAQHPARRTFQALRIAVNDELAALEQGLDAAVRRLVPGGSVAVLTFHSLEDRIVKKKFQAAARGCLCPAEFPACVCGQKPLLTALSRRSPSPEECERNPRASSARLRAARRTEE